MSKSILVIDTPSVCDECPFFEEINEARYWCYAAKMSVPYGIKSVLCPLKPMPEPYNMENVVCDRDYDGDYEYGYNACIDKILNGDKTDCWP